MSPSNPFPAPMRPLWATRTDTRPDARTYARVLLASIAERHRWQAQYEAAKAAALVDHRSATTPPPAPG